MGILTQDEADVHDKRVLFYRRHKWIRRASLLYILPLAALASVLFVLPWNGLKGLLEFLQDIVKFVKGIWSGDARTIGEQVERQMSRR